MEDVKLGDISGTKRRNIRKLKFINLKLTFIYKNIRQLYRGISGFKKSYHPRTNAVKDEKDDLVSDSNNILAR
jgi:hypothetical protein